MAKSTIPKEPLKKYSGEIATTGTDRDILRGPVDVYQPYDYGILKDIAGNLDTFERVAQDSEVQSVLQQRRLALISKETIVKPGGDSALDIAAADFMREQLEALNWDDITDKMHWGVYYGFSIAELMYIRDGSKILVDCIKVRNRRRFRYDGDMNLRLLTRQHAMKGELMPPGKFWTFATGGDNHDNPYGIGLAHWLYWPTYFKNNGIKFWMIYLDKFAMPTALGTHNFGEDEEKINQVLSALKAVHTDSGIAIPKGMVEVELLEASRSGTSDYKTMVGYMDAAIQKVTIGQTASSEGTAGKLGNEDLQAEVRTDIIKADSDLICEAWNRGPGRWLTAWNFPGAKPPKVTRDVEPPEDMVARAERDSKVSSMGFKPSLAYVEETYGEGWEAVEQKTAAPAAETDSENSATFAQARRLPPEDVLDAALDDLIANGADLDENTEELIEPVFNLVQRVGPAKAVGRLAEVYPSIDAEKLTEAVARVNFAAHIWGRLNG